MVATSYNQAMKNLADLDPNEIDPDGVGYFDGYGSMPDPDKYRPSTASGVLEK